MHVPPELKLLIVGLGNKSLPGTRHSVGHLVLDALAASRGQSLKHSSSDNGSLAQADVELNNALWRLYFFKPDPLMNILGPSVRSALRTTAVSNPSSLVVIHDDLRLPSFTLKHQLATAAAKSAASAHGGLKSISAALASRAFHRLRVGIDAPSSSAQTAAYVLGRLSAQEKLHWSADGPGTLDAWSALAKIANEVQQQRGPRGPGGPSR